MHCSKFLSCGSGVDLPKGDGTGEDGLNYGIVGVV